MNLNISPVKFIKTLVTFSIIIYGYNLFLDLFLDDAGLYASISKTMLENNDFLSLVHNHKDWLDKPHFPFWITAFTFRVFGISPLTYFLPLTISILLSLRYTFLFGKRYYNELIAWVSVLVLSTAQYTYMSSIEGRVEPFLMLFIIASIYHFDVAFSNKNNYHTLLFALFVACAIMTKGIFVIVPIGSAIVGHMLFQKQGLKKLLSWRLMLATTAVLILLFPEFYALYYQFDSNPDKIVFDKKGVSGIKWFLWDSQFSRLINSGPITRDGGDIFFYLHTILWAFFPWAFLLFIAVYNNIKGFFSKINLNKNEYYTLFGGICTFLLFSISNFQLPHYLTIVFPLYAVLISSFLAKELEVLQNKVVLVSQKVVVFFSALVLVFLMIISKVQVSFIFFTITLVTVFVWLLVNSRIEKKWKYFTSMAFTALLINSFLSISLFPSISQFRADINTAKFVNKNVDDESQIHIIGLTTNLFDFYTNKQFIKSRYYSDNAKKSQYLLCFEKNDSIIKVIKQDYNLVKKFKHFNSENISLNFVNPNRREKVLMEVLFFKKKNKSLTDFYHVLP